MIDESSLRESGWAWRGERWGAGLAPTRRYRRPEPSAAYAIEIRLSSGRPCSCACSNAHNGESETQGRARFTGEQVGVAGRAMGCWIGAYP